MVSQGDTIEAPLKALADTTRRGILGLLHGRQLSVLEIAEEFPMSRPAISKHLRILKEAGLVLETPSGRHRLYALERAPLELLAAWLAGFNGGGTRKGAMGEPSIAAVRVKRLSSSVRRREASGDWRIW